MGIGDSVGKGVAVGTSVGLSVGAILAIGVSVAVGATVSALAEVDAGSGVVVETDDGLEVQAPIAKSRMIKNTLCLLISFLSQLQPPNRQGFMCAKPSHSPEWNQAKRDPLYPCLGSKASARPSLTATCRTRPT